MDRVRKLKLNAATSLINRFAILISGLILPRLILVYYGSEINGLTSSIGQFLSIITFLDMGVGAVVQAALYRPIAKDQTEQISLIIKSASNYFKKIAYALLLYIVILVIVFPSMVQGEVDYVSTILLIIAMSINRFAQYYFGIVNELLLNADQKSYIQLTSETVTVIVNIFVTVFLIISGYSIVIVKIATGLIYLIRPVYLKYYVDKNYTIDTSVVIVEEPIKQKWNGVAQHTASVVLSSTDTIVLSLFTSLETVSIYSIYNMVVEGIKLVISSLITGTQAFFGNLLSNDELELLESYFTKIEWLIHKTVIYLYGLTAVLITPFVMIYTQGVEDANYYAPVFAIILVLSKTAYTLRLPYNSLILAAGHFKETQHSAVIEVLINVVISVAVVYRFGIIGVAIGTLVAMAYRTLYLVHYLSKNIINRPLIKFVKHLFIDILTFGIYLLLGSLMNIEVSTLYHWVIYAIVLAIIFLIVLMVINLVFYKDLTIYYVKQLLRKK